MIKFDLEKALAGEKVINCDHQPIIQLTQFKLYSGDALYGLNCDEDRVECYLPENLFMAPKKLSGFLNVYSNTHHSAHSSREAADVFTVDTPLINRIACIDLSQFEEGHGL